jgi:hypothetical protein
MDMPSSSRWPLVAALLVTALSACAPATPAADAASAPEVLDRKAAIASATRDASFQYGGDAWIAKTFAHQDGRFWIIELHAKSGALVRYAISTRDGGIRERAVLQ